MLVEIEIVAGPGHKDPTREDMQKNIDALTRAIDGKQLANDFILLLDTKSLLVGLQSKLPAT